MYFLRPSLSITIGVFVMFYDWNIVCSDHIAYQNNLPRSALGVSRLEPSAQNSNFTTLRSKFANRISRPVLIGTINI